MLSKVSLRASIKESKLALTNLQKENYAKLLVKKIESNQFFKQAKNVMIYKAMADEIALDELFEHYKKEKHFWLPHITGKSTMVAKEYTNNSILKKNTYGIEEPINSTPEAQNLELIIVPGIAFDRNKNRLGRGCGYYDRFLYQYPQAYTIGVCFPEQIEEYVPHDIYDICMNEVITP